MMAAGLAPSCPRPTGYPSRDGKSDGSGATCALVRQSSGALPQVGSRPLARDPPPGLLAMSGAVVVEAPYRSMGVPGRLRRRSPGHSSSSVCGGERWPSRSKALPC